MRCSLVGSCQGGTRGCRPTSPMPLHQWSVLRLGPPAADVAHVCGVATVLGAQIRGIGMLLVAVEPAFFICTCMCFISSLHHDLYSIVPLRLGRVVHLVWILQVWWMLCHYCIVPLTDVLLSPHRRMLCRCGCSECSSSLDGSFSIL